MSQHWGLWDRLIQACAPKCILKSMNHFKIWKGYLYEHFSAYASGIKIIHDMVSR